MPADLFAQHAAGADVGGDHRLFHHAVGDAARLHVDGQHFAVFTQLEVVVGSVREHQGVLGAPLDASLVIAFIRGSWARTPASISSALPCSAQSETSS